MLKKVFASLIFFATCDSANVVFADLVFSDSFNNNGVLVGSAPQTGGNWAQTGTVITNPLAITGNALAIGNTGQDANSAFSNSVSAISIGNSIVTSFTINVSAANTAGDYFTHLSDGGTTNFWQRVFVRSSGGGFQIGINPNSTTATTYGTNIFALNTVHSVQATWDFLAGATNDLITVSVNGVSEVSSSTWTTNPEPLSITHANIRQGTAANAPQLVLDNLSVTAVPEPSSIALVSLMGCAGLVIANRRRKAKLALA